MSNSDLDFWLNAENVKWTLYEGRGAFFAIYIHKWTKSTEIQETEVILRRLAVRIFPYQVHGD